MKKLKYLTAIAVILTLSIIGFSSFSASDIKTVEVDGLTYEVVGEHNGENIVKVYTAYRFAGKEIVQLGGYGLKSHESIQGNYNTYEKAKTRCEVFLMANTGIYDTYIARVGEGFALEKDLPGLYVK